jgi:REP element-mobilizing transposase RayT
MKPIPRLETRPPSRGNRLLGSCNQSGYPVHIVLGTYKSRPLFREPALAAPLFAIVADHSQTRACCLMPDHLHWLMQLREGYTLSQVVGFVKSSTSRALNLRYLHSGRVWVDGFHDHAIRREERLRDCARYIIANPVRAGLVERPGDYPLWDAAWLS